ncbi:helix-turn-helix domain-containing protein [Ruminiclostridium josui]|uniref:helix-turn-helix domain-containing protein n=1 Tax=Ruminiclostridium josui TaxID=1499 RepID=UPI0006D0A4ED
MKKICRGHLISRKNHQSNSAIPCGRPPKYSKKQLSEALKLRDRYSFQEIANITGICKSTLLNASKKMQI